MEGLSTLKSRSLIDLRFTDRSGEGVLSDRWEISAGGSNPEGRFWNETSEYLLRSSDMEVEVSSAVLVPEMAAFRLLGLLLPIEGL